MSKHRLTRISCATLTLALASGLLAAACSSDSDGTGDGNGSSAGSSNGTAGHGGSSSSGGSSAQPGAGSSSGGSSAVAGSSASSGAGTSGVVPTDACPGLPFTDAGQAGATGDAGASGDMACTGVSVETEAVPVDMLIMMDRSQSLGTLLPNSTMTRWDALHAAVQAFVSSPRAGAIGAGIGFFPITDHGDETLDCSVADYAKPAVGIAPLVMSGPDLVKAISDTPPGGLTPLVLSLIHI